MAFPIGRRAARLQPSTSVGAATGEDLTPQVDVLLQILVDRLARHYLLWKVTCLRRHRFERASRLLCQSPFGPDHDQSQIHRPVRLASADAALSPAQSFCVSSQELADYGGAVCRLRAVRMAVHGQSTSALEAVAIINWIRSADAAEAPASVVESRSTATGQSRVLCDPASGEITSRRVAELCGWSESREDSAFLSNRLSGERSSAKPPVENTAELLHSRLKLSHRSRTARLTACKYRRESGS